MPVITPQQQTAAPTAPSAAARPAGPVPPTTPTTDPDPAPKRRWILPVVLGAVVLGGVAVLVGLLGGDDDADTDVATSPIRAVTAEARDLSEFDELSGTLAYADAVPHSPSTDGVITAIASEGDVLGRGDVAYEINDQPVVVFYGDSPTYRELADGAEGDDVFLLEQNLAALGYDEFSIMAVDGVYDETTADIVDAWKTDLGLEENGVVEPGLILVTEGPALVAGVETALGSGARAGTPIMSLSITDRTTTVLAGRDGRITMLPSEGTTVQTGDVLYEVDTQPVIAIVGDTPIDRLISSGSENGEDVEFLEQTLVDLGFDADGDLEVDEVFTNDTAAAIEDWQESLGLDPSGVVGPESVVVVPDGHRVLELDVERGDFVGTDGPVLVMGESTRAVTTAVEVREQDTLPLGAAVEVEFPDGERVPGVVTEVATTSQLDPTDPGAEPTLAVTIEISQLPASAAGLSEVDVDVLVTTEVAAGATVVPATALVGVGDGTFAVEVVNADGATTSFVAVEPGLFADGFVEVTGIEAGTAVVVPS